MLTLSGRRHPYCDGVSRRSFLQVGAMGVGGLSLASLLRAEARAGVGSSNKAIINIHLGGGPSHQDMFDLKPEAPVEFRGEFNPIKTNVSGIEICEHMPQLAQMADKYVIVRSLVGQRDDHDNYQTHSGYNKRDLENAGGRPALGSVVARVIGPTAGGAPPFISYNGGSPGYLGAVYKPYSPSGGDLRLGGSLTEERLGQRTSLLRSLDRIRRDVDNSGEMRAMDSFTQRAVGVVVSGKVADALDLDKEPVEGRERYGRNEGNDFLRARRLIEAGVRCVTFNWGGWDTHGDNFNQLRRQLPRLDRGLSALLSDLHERGLEKDVVVVMWGEFGRTPRVNSGAGRDHWSPVAMAFFAGGGMRMGQVLGSTTRNAEYAKDRPVHFLEIFATLYHHFGIDVKSQQLTDTAGRPQYLTGEYRPLKELV